MPTQCIIPIYTSQISSHFPNKNITPIRQSVKTEQLSEDRNKNVMRLGWDK